MLFIYAHVPLYRLWCHLALTAAGTARGSVRETLIMLSSHVPDISLSHTLALSLFTVNVYSIHLTERERELRFKLIRYVYVYIDLQLYLTYNGLTNPLLDI